MLNLTDFILLRVCFGVCFCFFSLLGRISWLFWGHFVMCYLKRQRSHFDDFACGSLSVFPESQVSNKLHK